MLKVLLLRNVFSDSKYGGIRKHCQELYSMFEGHSKIKILPIENLPNFLIPIIRKKIFSWKQLYSYVKQSGCDVVHIHGFATLDVLQSLKKQGAKVGIISTKYRYRIQELLQPLLPSDFLDVLIGGEDVHAAKPDPEGLLMALQHIGVPTDEALYIGDSIVDAQTAQAAGTDFAGVLHGMTTRDELEGWPNVAVMNDLNELLSYD